MENQAPDFKKHSRTGSIISAAGLIVVLLSVGLFIYFDRKKEEKNVTTENQLVRKDSVASLMNDSLNTVRKIIQDDLVECNAVLLNESMADGKPLYIFTLKVKDSLLVTKLKQVDYFFDHPSYHPKLKVSTDARNAFKFTYRGWGCIENVPVYLHYREGSRVDTVIFPMCDKTKIELKPE